MVDGIAAPADDFREFVALEKERLEIPAVSVALIDRGNVQYISLGVRQAGQNDPITNLDPFDVGSVSKTITAWAVMILAERGLVELDAPVQQYFSQRWQFPASEFDSASVTLRRILSHTAGLSAPSFQGFPPGSISMSLEDSLNGNPIPSSAVRIIAEPGSEHRYSGGGFALAQLVVESVTGRSFSEFVTSEIFEPLGMDQAQYLTFDDEPLPVSPHDFGGRPITDYRMVEQGAGGLRASAQDLAKFLIANMSDNPVLADSTVNEMHEPLASFGGDSRPTLGFERRGTLLSHGGGNRGWVAQINFQSASRSGLVILTNSADGRRMTQSVQCHWSEVFEIDDLTTLCEQQNRNERVTYWTLVAVALVILALATWIAWRGYLRVRDRLARVSVDASTIGRSSFFVLSMAALWAMLGTDLGAYLIGGMSWEFSTIAYLPIAAKYVATAITILLAVLASTSFLRRHSA